MKQLCTEQKLGGKDALKVAGLKDMQYRILKIIGDDILKEVDNIVSKKTCFSLFKHLLRAF